jgi:hypothetical protein
LLQLGDEHHLLLLLACLAQLSPRSVSYSQCSFVSSLSRYPPTPPFCSTQICHRTGKKLYPADKKFEVKNLRETWHFSSAGFTCKATGARLTMKTFVVFDGEVYLRGKEPIAKPTQVKDVNDDRVAAVPDSTMRTGDRMFNVAGKQAHRGTKGDDLGSNYGVEAVGVVTQTTVPDPAMRTGDRKFVIAGQATTGRGHTDGTTLQGSAYGLDGQVMDTQLNVVQPASKGLANVARHEVRHNGTDLYSGSKPAEAAE